MKVLVLVLMSVVYFGSAQAETVKTSTVISKKIIGGAVLVIGNKGSVTIEKKTEDALTKQLGADKKQELYTDLLLETSMTDISKKYASNKSKALSEILFQYEKIINTKDIASN